MQAISTAGAFDNLDSVEQRHLRNLPSYAFYGVDTELSVAARLAGVPRSAAKQIAETLTQQSPDARSMGSAEFRTKIQAAGSQLWSQALGSRGEAYETVWKILDGVI
jgi:hypothetical protein